VGLGLEHELTGVVVKEEIRCGEDDEEHDYGDGNDEREVRASGYVRVRGWRNPVHDSFDATRCVERCPMLMLRLLSQQSISLERKRESCTLQLTFRRAVLPVERFKNAGDPFSLFS
jgi:hypothetical protein